MEAPLGSIDCKECPERNSSQDEAYILVMSSYTQDLSIYFTTGFVNITLIFSVSGCKYVTRDVDIRKLLGLGQIFIVSNPVQYGNHALYHSCICLT